MTIDGAPMIFYGQELGTSKTFGFDRYSTIGKTIPHFMKFNSLQPILYPGNRNFGLDQLQPVYSAINQARQSSRAMRSSNRYFINTTGGGVAAQIHAVVKYETANSTPNFSDVVFAFANLDRNNNQSGTFNVNITQGTGNLFGIKSNRLYNVKNIAAYTGADANRRNVWQWGVTGVTGSNVLANGVSVSLNKVPATAAAWTNAPFEAQYLKLYDVTPPPTPPMFQFADSLLLTNRVNFSWGGVFDSEGGIAGYHLIVGTSPGLSNVFDGMVTNATSLVVTGMYGQTVYGKAAAINNAGIQSAFSTVPATYTFLDPTADSDGDGMNNADEVVAGTNPLDSDSVLRVLSVSADGLQVTWTSASGKNYRVLAATNLAAGFPALSGILPSGGVTTVYTNPNPSGASLFYRVQVVP